MKQPDLTDSNKRMLDVLSDYSEDKLSPTKQFKHYARNFKDLSDTPELSNPLYVDFEDFDYAHDTTRLKQIYINDYDFNLEDDREELAALTRMEFSGNTFDSVAKCSESCGRLKGNYLLNSGRVCEHCGNEVELFLDRGEDAALWIKLPEGVKTFVNHGLYASFFNNISIGTPKVCIPRYFLDSTYRMQVNKGRNTTGVLIKNMLDTLNIEEVSLNSFYDNCDAILDWIFKGEGRRHFKSIRDTQHYIDFWERYKKVAFCKYIKVPSRFTTILEKNGREIYSYAHQPATSQIYFAIADTLKSNSLHTLNERELKRNADIVGRNLVKLSEQYRKVNNQETLFAKKSINRKHVCSGAIPFTGRSIITSRTGIISIDELLVPWKMCLSILEIHITSYLYRRGFTPYQVKEKINNSAYKIDPLIDEFFAQMESENKCLVQSGRNPSIEHLSLRTFFLRVNRDLEDESIKIPILAIGTQNAKLH